MKKILILTMLLAAISCSQTAVKKIDVVPYPNHVEIKNGCFNAAGATFHLDSAIDEPSRNILNVFAEQLTFVSGIASEVNEGIAESGFVFIQDTEIPSEAYTVEITRKGVQVKASGLNGFNYAVQTLKQMLPVEIFGKTQVSGLDWKLPCAVIEDAPRFSYRGQHIDEARHFFGLDEMKKILDLMEVHKMNTLHWHLTDDQGWRIEIKKYPKLTTIGSIRKETLVGHAYNNQGFDGTPYGEGMWYTQEEAKELISYAAAKGITIIPEIDLPGHMLAALTAYPELGCTGGPYDVWGMWGIADDVLCVGKEKTMIFLENVLSEIAELFPAEYIHIGGDECPKVRWEKCPLCQKKIKELGLKDSDKFDAEHYLQSYVMKRMTDFLTSKGKKVIGWDEILEGDVADNAIIMSWRGTAGGLQAAKMGHDAIMTPTTYCYIDYYQSLDQKNEPLAIGGYLPVEKVYSYEPFVEEMTDEEKGHIKGVQTNLWTEYIGTGSHLEYMLLPRMTAISEVQWCDADNKCWERFSNSAGHFAAIYEQMGVNYAQHIFHTKGEVGLDQENNAVLMTLYGQGDADIHYTLDGSEPTVDSPVYTKPIAITEGCTVKAKTFRNNVEDRTFVKEFVGHKALGKKVTLNTTPAPSYKFNAPYLFVDGIRGVNNFRSGEWAGWQAEPLEVTIDMNGEAYDSVTVGTFIAKYDWIFNPKSITVSTSEDGETFTEVGKAEYKAEGEKEADGLKEYTVTFPETSAKYLKVLVETVTIPQWHGGAGSPGFIFVDEILVK